jgi:UMF1 family MFS transporter
LLAYYLINDGVTTVGYFCVIFFMTTFGLPVEHVLWLTLLFHVIAIPSTAFFGWLGGRWSERGALFVTLAIWIGVLLIMASATQPFVPLLLTVMIGLVLGSTQALCRSLYAGMIPTERTSEFYGFNALAGRASAALGPALFGAVSTISGSQRVAMLSHAVFLAAGGVILSSVGLPKREEP